MKHIRLNFLKYAILTFGMLLLSNCEEKEPDDILSVSPTKLSFTADDTKEEIVTVTTNTDAWSFQVSDSWVTARKENDELRISVQNYNETGEQRHAEINIAAGAANTVTVRISQSARNSLSVIPESLSYDADEIGSQTINVTTGAQSWDATTNDSWISLSKQGNTLIVTVSTKNTGSSPRSATIRITAENALEKTVTVTQAARHTLSVDPSSLSFEADDTSEKTVTVTTTASGWDATTEASWITLNKQNNTLWVSVSKNTGSSDRNANVIITAGNAPPVTVSVMQASGTIVPDSDYGNGSGQIINDPSGKFFTITNFGNRSISVQCLYKNGKIIIDGETRVVDDNTNNANGYFRVCTQNENGITVYPGSYEYAVNYDISTRTLDFSGTINGQPALVGVVAFSKSTGNPIGLYTDLYANLKLTLTSTSSASQLSGDAIVSAGDIDNKNYKVREASILEMTDNITGSSGEKHIIKQHQTQNNLP
jgi:hypothetical protein